MNIGGLRKGRLLAGSRGLNRVIQDVNILEAPWEPNWETKDQLFLTSFYALSNNVQMQIENIIGLNKNGCTALVFQKGVQDALDPRVIQAAEAVDLPLIEIEEEVAYPEIITPLIQAISQEKSFLLQRSQEIHNRLTGLILSGDGLPAVVDALQELIKRPVGIISTWGEVLAGQSFSQETEDQIKSKKFLREIMHSASSRLAWHKESGCWLTPLVSGEQGQMEGFLLVWDAQKAANPLDLTAIEQAAIVASLELAKRRAVLETERRLKRDFLDDMLAGEYHSVDALLARGRSLGWDLINKRVVMVVDLNQFEAYYLRHIDQSEEHFQQIKRRFLQGVLRVVQSENPLAIVVERSDSVVVMPHFAAEMPLTQAQRATHSLAEIICAGVPETLDELSISIAIGSFYEHVSGLRASYQEATAALDVITRLSHKPPIVWYEDVGHYVLFRRFADQAEVSHWLDQTLGRLITYDQRNDTELVKTLEFYFDANQVNQQAATRLFVHPKTLKYRLRRIEEILGIDPFAGERQLAYYLATKLLRLRLAHSEPTA